MPFIDFPILEMFTKIFTADKTVLMPMEKWSILRFVIQEEGSRN